MPHRAYVVEKHGPPEAHNVQSVTTPEPGAGEVLLAVQAAGVNYPDTLQIRGKYQFQPEMPFSPGSEVAGVVAAIGPDVTGVKVGDAMIANAGHGGFSERLVVEADKLMPLPKSMTPLTGAAFTMVYGTSYYALKDVAKVREGETLLVLGASGGVGLAAVELGKIMGARVIACASSAEKLEVCREKGADALIEYDPVFSKDAANALKGAIKTATGSLGIDVCYDPIGADWAEVAIRNMAWGGRYLVVGFAAGHIPRIPLNLPLLKGCSLMGVFWGSWAMRDPQGAGEPSVPAS